MIIDPPIGAFQVERDFFGMDREKIPDAFRVVKQSGKVIFLDYDEAKEHIEYSYPGRPKEIPIGVGIIGELYRSNDVTALFAEP